MRQLTLLLLCLLFSANLSLALAKPLPKIIIDAGHGGEELGAIGVCGAVEKDITLQIAKLLSALLVESGEVQVFLTRQKDETIKIRDRVAWINRLQGELLLSIHANSLAAKHIAGAQTFFLAPAGVAKQLTRLQATNKTNKEPKDNPHSPEIPQILQALELNAHHQESQRLALRIQADLVSALPGELPRHTTTQETTANLDSPPDTTREPLAKSSLPFAVLQNKGVLQAEFMILKGVNLPAVLVEVGFLTNAAECFKLKDETYLEKIAQRLAVSILTHVSLTNKTAFFEHLSLN